ncbi:hypothetical protein A2196_03505 [Candidatus Curtissbacteria bacterium RIFOXYA1_FULL_41_14]|uniref:Membrane protein 6-pyruvoyl-tetrahydropterin synthase-related domain-containing protein n=1 Tax=Candidatus Curtissbacteria bacterium RIFOXYA1_FULL_41_14 TaxID=1797737 RepID=A0A1F5HFT6_9BACT|nr:MAG: hypothetical protein A2196_03505 [Candidatus Curtissbacteria bacterium RIFOXYA1_FULL_41_14]
MRSIFILFTLLSFSLFWPVFLGKVNLNGNLLVSFYRLYGENLPYKPTGWDQLRIYFPFYKITFDQFKNFNPPLWNSYAFSGHPHLADFQSAVFYPLNIFGLILPQIEFWHLLRITPMILASFFMFLFLKNLRINNRHPELASGSSIKIPKRVRNDTSGLSTLASLFGAITFGFSPFILTWGEEVIMSPHSIIWLPLILFSIEKLLNPLPNLHSRSEIKPISQEHSGSVSKGVYLAIISLSTAFSFFGGYMQTTIYLLIFSFAYLVFRLWQFRERVKIFARLTTFLQIIGAFVLGTGISAIQLLPSAELYFNSARASITLRETLFQFLLPIESLLTLLAPDFFGHPATWNFFRGGVAQYYEGILFVGITPLIFALWVIFTKNRDKLVTFLAVFALASASTTLDLPTSRLFLSLPIPFLSTSIANRILFIPAFCLATLAAIGCQKWLAERNKKIIKVILSLGFVYATIIFVLISIKFFNLPFFNQGNFTSAKNVVVALRNLVVPLLAFGVSSFLIIFATYVNRAKSLAIIGIIIISFLHIFYFSQKYLSFAQRETIFPKTPILEFIQKNQVYFRSWAIGGDTFSNNFASQYAIFWPEGYDSLNNRNYSEFTFAMQGNNLDDYKQRSDADLGTIGKVEEIMGNKNRKRLLDIIGVKYLIATGEAAPIVEEQNFKKVFESSGFAVFENQQVIPRAFLASNYEGPPQIDATGLSQKEADIARRKLIPQKLLSDDFDFRNVLILEKPSPISAQYGPGSAEIISYKPQEVVVKTQSDQPKLLFLSDNYYPGWKAQVDGEETPVLRADYTFRAVPLIPGEHLVRFYYDPWTFKLGLGISLASLGFLAFYALRSKIFNFKF